MVPESFQALPANERLMAMASDASCPQSPWRLGSLWSTLDDPQPSWFQPKEGWLRSVGAAVVWWWGAAWATVTGCGHSRRPKPVLMGKVALTLISLFMFLQELRNIVSHSIWTILTIVVVLEFNTGGRPYNTLYALRCFFFTFWVIVLLPSL
jgi:hypothetical protein